MFGVKESLLADFRKVEDDVKTSAFGFASGWFWSVDFDFVLARTITTKPMTIQPPPLSGKFEVPDRGSNLHQSHGKS